MYRVRARQRESAYRIAAAVSLFADSEASGHLARIEQLSDDDKLVAGAVLLLESIHGRQGAREDQSRDLDFLDELARRTGVGDLQAELVEDFFEGFARGARANVHMKTMYGRSNHHKIEALFKAFARALRFACSRDPQLKEQLPSTKGLL